MAASAAAMGFSGGLKDGATEAGKLSDELDKALKEAKTKSEGIFDAITGATLGKGEQKRTFVSIQEEEYKAKMDKAREDEEAAQKEFAGRLRINVAGAFEEGLYDAMDGGDFFKSFGNNLKRQVLSAMSSAITGQLFGIGQNAGSFSIQGGGLSLGSGSILAGGGAGGGGSIVNALLSGGGSAGGGGGFGGILGGMTAPLQYLTSPAYRLANTAAGSGFAGGFAQSLMSPAFLGGAALSFLSQPGRLLGGSITHGQDQIALSGDINTQVTQAKKQRDELLGTIGATAATMRELQEMVFSMTGTVKHKSGDGIFSKKTTTYEATGVTEAYNSITKFTELSAKVLAEAAARSFEIALKQITSPLEALNMTIHDLAVAANGATGAKQIELLDQMELLKAQKRQMAEQFSASWFSTRLGTAATSAGNMNFPAMESGDVTRYHLDLLGKQGAREYDLNKMGVLAANGESENAQYLQARKDYLSDSLKTYETAMREAAARAAAAKDNTEAASRAIQEFSAAQSGYYSTKLAQLQAEQEAAAAIKAKQEAIKQNKIADALTWLGEQSTQGGQQVLILAAGSADTTARLKAIRDGLDAEGAKVIDDIIAQTSSGSARWN
jgi:hypothetical protein